MSGLLTGRVVAASPLTVKVWPGDVTEKAETMVTGLAGDNVVYMLRRDDNGIPVVVGKVT